MGMFTQRPEDKGAWAALPGEPAPDAEDALPPASTDLFSVSLGATVESIVFPVPPPAPAASDQTDAAPLDAD